MGFRIFGAAAPDVPLGIIIVQTELIRQLQSQSQLILLPAADPIIRIGWLSQAKGVGMRPILAPLAAYVDQYMAVIIAQLRFFHRIARRDRNTAARLALRLLQYHVDDAADSLAAIQGGTSPFDDLNSFNHPDWYILRARRIPEVHGNAIHEHQGSAFIPAKGDSPRLCTEILPRLPAIRRIFCAKLLIDGLIGRTIARPFNLVRGDDRHRGRRLQLRPAHALRCHQLLIQGIFIKRLAVIHEVSRLAIRSLRLYDSPRYTIEQHAKYCQC